MLAGKLELGCYWMFSQILLVGALQCRPALKKGPAASNSNCTSPWVISLTLHSQVPVTAELKLRQRLVSASPHEVHTVLLQAHS